MSRFQKGFIGPIVIAVVAVLAIGGVAYFASHEKAEAPEMVVQSNVPVQSTSTNVNATSTNNSGEIYITSISPSFGPVGSTVTLRGNGFTLGKQVFVSISDSNLKAWEVVSVSTTTLVFVIPNDLSVGTHDVSVLVSAKYTPVSNSVKFAVTNNNTASPAPVACTMDAMMCPDGSYVGRSGPNCEFVCPK